MKKYESLKAYIGVTLDLKEKECPIVEIPIKPKSDYTEIVLMGDFHVGSSGFSEHQLVAYINWIKKNSNVRVILMGDMLEIAELSSYTPEQKDTFKKQIQILVSLLKPIKDQIICMLEGNHEERFSKVVEGAIDLTEYIAAELGIKDKVILVGPQKGIIIICKVKEQHYPIYVLHGHTSAIFNKGTQLKRMAFTSKVPLLAHGHTHQIYHDHYVYRGITKVNDKFYESIYEQHWLATGCFVKYLGYAERASYPMSKIGAPIIRLYGDKENLMVIDDARSFYGIGTEYKDPSAGGFTGTASEIDDKILHQMKEGLGIKLEEPINFISIKISRSAGVNRKCLL